MSHESVDLLKAGYERWSADGIEAAVANFLHPDVELYDLVEMPDGLVYRGHDGARAMWARWTEVWEEFRFQLDEAEELGDDQVLAKVRAVGRTGPDDPVLEIFFYEV